MRGLAVADRRGMGLAQNALRFGRIRPAHVALHGQRLDDVHHVFVMHFHARRCASALCSMAVPERPLETMKKGCVASLMAFAR